MNLGLDKLTDDQVMTLLQEVLGELASRDPLVRRIAQEKIIEESEKLDIAKAELKAAVASAKAQYIEDLKLQIYADVKDAVRRGEIRLDISEETNLVLQAHGEAMIQLKQEAVAALNPSGSGSSDISFTFSGSTFQMRHKGTTISSRFTLSKRNAQSILDAITKVADEATML